MATLADALRQTGYVQDNQPVPQPSTGMAEMLRQHIASIPQKFEENQANQMAALQRAFPDNTLANADPHAMAQYAMQVPLTGMVAYHGTPHNILGKFDISKVGTGEGNQTFSHGMYFAENPAVAKQYQAALSNTKYKVGEKELKGNEAWAAQFLHDFQEDALPKRVDVKTAVNKAKEILKPGETQDEIVNNIKALDKSGLTVENGNLYKVDIPDEYIPNMLHWDKPLTEQTPQVQKSLEKLGIKVDKQKLSEFDDALLEALHGDAKKSLPNQPNNPLGSEIYERLLKGSPESKSAKLNELGIKGVSYLDEGSRGWRMLTPEESTSGKYVVGKWPGGGKEQKYFDNLKEAQDYLNQNQTRNHVVFEPSEVQILEKNSQPVSRKELIEQQVNKLKD